MNLCAERIAVSSVAYGDLHLIFLECALWVHNMTENAQVMLRIWEEINRAELNTIRSLFTTLCCAVCVCCFHCFRSGFCLYIYKQPQVSVKTIAH